MHIYTFYTLTTPEAAAQQAAQHKITKYSKLTSTQSSTQLPEKLQARGMTRPLS